MRLKFSQDLIVLLNREREQPLTLADILAESSERSFALVICLLALPFILPMPPGASAFFGAACLLLSLQMAAGRHLPWLPARIAKMQLSPRLIAQLIRLLKRFAWALEKITKPRWARIVRSEYVWQINGACITWLTLLLMLPVPLTNPIPTVGILLLAVSMLENDGLLMFAGYCVVGLNTALFGAIATLLVRSPEMFQQYF